tara:strand:- start:371 stop:601 length:231 start_codon:yes stop_codon:yes gene_type:complete
MFINVKYVKHYTKYVFQKKKLMMDLFRHLRIHTKRREFGMLEKLKNIWETFEELKTWVQILIFCVILIVIHSTVLH